MQLEIITSESEITRRLIPLLLIHGGWHSAWCWREHFMPYFSRSGYVCYALSLRGHGTSQNDKPLRWTGAWDYVEDVNQAVEYIEQKVPNRPVLIGHAMGGYVVQKYLEKYDAPAAVLLASIPSKGALAYFLRNTARHPLTMLKCMLQLRAWPIIGTRELMQEAFFSEGMPEQKIRTYHARMQDESFKIGFDSSLLERPRPEIVRAKHIPMLVLGAANDNIVMVHEVETTANAYGTKAEIFPDMAHDMMLEAGWLHVADRILGWLDAEGF